MKENPPQPLVALMALSWTTGDIVMVIVGDGNDTHQKKKCKDQ